ncbi:MAG TPA: serine/threonine-protein kinase [Chitinivibrionales bacterium]|nr:serine/threonine-protein kinase [Chitinivibrionales bacterium]
MASIVRSSGVEWAGFIGRDLGNVTLISELGRGVMGVVFVGYQKTLRRQVAVKVLVKAKAQASGELASDLFRDEGEMVAVLSHPNIIPIFEMGEADDCFYQVMQLVDGIDLRSTMRRLSKHPIPSKRLIPLSETIDFMMQVLDALGYAHEEGVIHQDIKPANILIENRSKRPLVADFGIARALSGEYKSEGLVVGTPLYMSPEQVNGKVTDGRTDIYSAGVILFEMVVGSLPVRPEEKTTQILLRKKNAPDTFFTAKPREMSPAISAELERVILKAVAPNLEWRYRDCRAFIDDLKKVRDLQSGRPLPGRAGASL